MFATLNVDEEKSAPSNIACWKSTVRNVASRQRALVMLALAKFVSFASTPSNVTPTIEAVTKVADTTIEPVISALSNVALLKFVCVQSDDTIHALVIIAPSH